MTSRSDGTNTTTYAWDEDNRLTLVTLPSSATVAYTYDVAGRMLTRTDSTGTTYFTWDGWTMVAELAPNGTQTRYYAPNGELLYIEVETATTDQPAAYGSAYYGQNYYGALVYQVVSDALGSVRRIVDAYNNVVSTFDYSAWGNQLPSTSDPLRFPYTFVGGYGVRWDSGTGLYYMRNRWYDPTLQRFIGRDALGSFNRYAYCLNSPMDLVDIDGREPQPPPSPHSGKTEGVSSPGEFDFKGWQDITDHLAPSSCPQGQKCFLICVRSIPDPDDPTKPWKNKKGNEIKHAFLVFGTKQRDVFGLKSPKELGVYGLASNGVRVTGVDYGALTDQASGNMTWAVKCNRYCASQDNYSAILDYAKAGVKPGNDYYDTESTEWVNTAMGKGGFSNGKGASTGGNWPGFGAPVHP